MYKQIRLVASDEILKKLKLVKDMVNLKHYKETAKAKAYLIRGFAVKKMNLKIPFKIIDNFTYEIIIFRTNEERINYEHNAPTIAKKIINKYILPKYPKEEYYEPVEDERLRPLDFMVLPPFENGGTYTGNWIDIDMNSAEPYFVSRLCPESKPAIENLFKKRKVNPYLKVALNSINGNLRNSNISLYVKVCNGLYEYMLQVIQILNKSGAKSAFLRRDGVLALVPDNYVIPKSIPLGEDMGQFKVIREYGTIHINNQFNYNTDMVEIESKHQGIESESLLQKINMVGDLKMKRGLKIG